MPDTLHVPSVHRRPCPQCGMTCMPMPLQADTLVAMITRLQGMLESIEGGRAVVAPVGAGVAYEVLIPAFLVVTLTPSVGQAVTLRTLQYLEGQGQGTSFIPRLVGFETTLQRDFFELFTSVNGIGNRRALRAMTLPPHAIARAIAEHDARLLATLPEVGKRMAERIIAELDGKVDAFLDVNATTGDTAARVDLKPSRMTGAWATPAAQDAVEALVALGETRPDAEEKVRRAVHAHPDAAKQRTPDAILASIFGA